MGVIQPNGTNTTYEYDGRDRQVAVNQNGSFVNHAGENGQWNLPNSQKT